MFSGNLSWINRSFFVERYEEERKAYECLLHMAVHHSYRYYLLFFSIY